MRPETVTQDVERAISTEASALRKRVRVGDTTMAYVDVGMGNSGAAPDGAYRFVDRQRISPTSGVNVVAWLTASRLQKSASCSDLWP